MKIRFIRFNELAKIPVRKYHSDTGSDIFMLEFGYIEAHQTLVIPLGFGIEIPNGYSARLQVRTSIAKKGIIIQGCAIDAGYVGEIHMILHNVSNESFYWNAGDRLGYIEIYPTQYPEFVEELLDTRENNNFGSSGR